MKYVIKFEDLTKNDIGIAGGKGANLGELTQAGIPVPPGFVVTAETYDKFMQDTGIFNSVMDILEDVDINNTKQLQEAAEEIKRIIIETPIPDDISTMIIEAYNQLSIRVGEEDDGADVAIRSSATAEDLPEASFAGQQDTFLHVQGIDQVIEYVRKCWASLFEARAIFYREENDFEHSKVYIAVVVQQMVDSDKAGVMFTVNPSTGENVALIEGSWGLGESVVSGTVTPDNYVVNKDNNEILNIVISDKKTMFANDAEGTSVQVPVPEEKRNERVLPDDELIELVEMGKRVQAHYGKPQDTEWAFHNGNLFLLQSRPITTLGNAEEKSEDVDLEVLIRGLGASPGLASGTVKIVNSLDELDKIQDGDVMVVAMTTPDMVPAMKRANGIVTDEGGVTCHAAIISRELGIPCVVGTGDATKSLDEGLEVTADGKKGLVYNGILKAESSANEDATANVQVAATPLITVTEVKANVSMPEAAPRARATGADGVGLLRTEHMMLSTGIHPKKFILDGNEEGLVDILAENVLKVADEFYPKPVWYRTLDAPTDEFITLEGGENEPREHNPMLGWRGIRRELDEPEILIAEFKAIKKLHDQGYTNIGIMIPLSQHVNELKQAKELCRSVGMEPGKDVEFGMMVEIPAAAIMIDEYIKEGIDFVSLGTNDLTQYTLAVDRNNEFVAKHYSEEHPAVMKLIERTIKKCAEAGVTCSICGQAGSVPHIVEKLVAYGITSVSSNADAVEDVRKTVARAEKKIILDAARRQM
ncbi:MAG: phosphoenolpyruvate synthase [archaeon]|nr:phosphoenolpyruvate synthase [archaeon]